MSFLTRIAGKLGFVPAATARKAARSYAAAQISRLTADWTTSTTSADTEIRNDLAKLRARSRQLERDNPYVERYFKLLENNVLAATGVGLQMKVRDPDTMQGGKVIFGKYDELANGTIEDAWAEWGARGACTLDGQHSWVDVQRLALRSAARDGAFFVRKLAGANRFNFALQLIESDYLDTNYEAILADGRFIRMGVEMTAQRQPVAFHFWTKHPGDYFSTGNGAFRRIRIPAEEIIHVFYATRPGQTTGAPWLAPVMLRLQMLNGYDEAELTAARAAACKMGFFTHQIPEGLQAPENADGDLLNEFQPGAMEDLPMGTNFQTFDPQHPTAAYPFFTKACLRSISSGAGVSYVSLANDLEGVNFSSIRAGLLEEREEWKKIQGWFIETLVQPVFESWLKMALLSGALALPNGSALPAAKFRKFNAPDWKPRRWAWVDPLKDQQANILAVQNGFRSRRSIIAEMGGDIEDVFTDLAADKQLADQKGLVLAPTDAPDKPQIGDSDP